MLTQACRQEIIEKVLECVEGLSNLRAVSDGERDALYVAEHVSYRLGMSIANTVLQAWVESQGKGHTGQQRQEEDGQVRQFKQYVTKTVETIVGPIEVRSAQYYAKGADPCSVYPLREALGLPEGQYSRGLEELIALAGSDGVYRHALKLLNRLTGATVSLQKAASTIRSWGQQAKAQRKTPSPPPATPAQRVESTRPIEGLRMCVSTDGTSVQTTQRWREVKLMASYQFDAAGKKDGPAQYAGTMDYQQDFSDLLWDLMQRTNAHRAKDLVWLGDGALWIWNQQQTLAPQAVAIVDFYHAADRLWQVARGAYPTSRRATAWAKKWIKNLYNGKVDALQRELKRHQHHLGDPPRDAHHDDPSKVVADALSYFRHNASRMQYHRYRAQRYPIGSGVVESSCRHVVGLRMKRTATMKWHDANADAMVQLRCLTAGGEWERFWGFDKLWDQIHRLAA